MSHYRLRYEARQFSSYGHWVLARRGWKLIFDDILPWYGWITVKTWEDEPSADDLLTTIEHDTTERTLENKHRRSKPRHFYSLRYREVDGSVRLQVTEEVGEKKLERIPATYEGSTSRPDPSPPTHGV